MGQARRCLRLGVKAFHKLFGGERPSTDDLESHQPFQGPLARLVDASHTALSDFLQQFVIAEMAADAGPSRCRWWLDRLSGGIKTERQQTLAAVPQRGVRM